MLRLPSFSLTILIANLGHMSLWSMGCRCSLRAHHYVEGRYKRAHVTWQTCTHLLSVWDILLALIKKTTTVYTFLGLQYETSWFLPTRGPYAIINTYLYTTVMCFNTLVSICKHHITTGRLLGKTKFLRSPANFFNLFKFKSVPQWTTSHDRSE